FNNMHGKPKLEKFYKHGQLESEAPKSYTKYDYKNTTVLPVVNENGIIENKNMGVQTDFYMDNRFQQSKTRMMTLTPGGGPSFFAILPITYFMMLYYSVKEEKTIDMISTNKVTTLSYVLDKTEVNKDGASVSTENLVWDKKTGEVVLSRMNNEYNKALYNFNMPAYWAYKNLGHTFPYSDYSLQMRPNNTSDDLSIEATSNHRNGHVLNKSNYLNEGDEVYIEDITNSSNPPIPVGKFFYITNVNATSTSTGGYDPLNLFVGYDGKSMQPLANKTYKVTVIRSASKNMQSVKAMTITTMEDPRAGNVFKSSLSKVMSGTATIYSDRWKWIAKRHLTPSAINNPMITTRRNPYVFGVFGNWRPLNSYSLLGNKSGFTNANENPNLGNDAINTDNPLGGGQSVNLFYVPTTNRWIRGTGLNWNSQSQNTLFDSKGNLVEEISRISKFVKCTP
ncbi:MAG: hypothetical protein ACOVP5_06920, partial [Chitinophagales bacterium]